MKINNYRRGDPSEGLQAARMMSVSNFYDDVVPTTKLPAQRRADDLVVSHGYAVELGLGPWFWFPALPPALAFGRAARMSAQCSRYGVHRAANETRFMPKTGTDRRTLHVVHDNLDRKPGEKQQLQAWVDGVDTSSSHWREPT